MEENDTINLVKHIQSLWKDETFCDVEYRFVSQKSRVGTFIERIVWRVFSTFNLSRNY